MRPVSASTSAANNPDQAKSLSYDDFQRIVKAEKLPVSVRYDSLYRYEDGEKEYWYGHQSLTAKSITQGPIETYVPSHGNSEEFPQTAEHEFTPANMEKVRKGCHKDTSYYMITSSGNGRKGITKEQFFSAHRDELLTVIKQVRIDVQSLIEAVNAVKAGGSQKQ